MESDFSANGIKTQGFHFLGYPSNLSICSNFTRHKALQCNEKMFH